MSNCPDEVLDVTWELINMAALRLGGSDGEAFLSAATDVGVATDTALVADRVIVDLLADPDWGIMQWLNTDAGVPVWGFDSAMRSLSQRDAGDLVLMLYRDRLRGEEPPAGFVRGVADQVARARSATRVDGSPVAVLDEAVRAFPTGGDPLHSVVADTYALVSRRPDSPAAHWRWIADRLMHHLRSA